MQQDRFPTAIPVHLHNNVIDPLFLDVIDEIGKELHMTLQSAFDGISSCWQGSWESQGRRRITWCGINSQVAEAIWQLREQYFS